MRLISSIKNFKYILILTFILFVVKPQMVLSASFTALQGLEEKHISEKILILKLDRDISLEDLISHSGYSFDDEHAHFFLEDFIKLNASIKSISLLKKGTVIRLPLKHLKSTARRNGKTYTSEASKIVKQKLFKKKEYKKETDEVFTPDKSIILLYVKTLFQALGDNVVLETEGLKIFDVGERSELALDKTFFPIIDLHNDHILVFDYKGILSEDLKNLLEISWPEFRVVSYREGMDTKKLVYFLLNESGYAVNESEKLVVGGRSRIEYYPDFLVFRKSGNLIESELSLVSIIDYDENKTPDTLIAWLNKRGIRLVELARQGTDKSRPKTSKAIRIRNLASEKEFTESILKALEYNFSRDKTIKISNRKEFIYNLKADLSLTVGNTLKVIEFSELSNHEMNHVRKQGVDIASIRPEEEREEIVRKITGLLSLEYSSLPKTTSVYITPKKVKYSLFLPGVFIKSRKGEFFFTDSELEYDLLETIIDEKITIATF